MYSRLRKVRICRIEGAGLTLTPGLIDSASYSLLTGPGNEAGELVERRGAADYRVTDGLDPFDETAVGAAHRFSTAGNRDTPHR